MKTIEKEERFRRKIWRTAIKVVPWVIRKPRIHMEPIGIDPPFLLIANHASNSDPIFMGFASPEEPLVYVASEHLERLGFLTKVLKKCFKFIPRKKATVAVETVKEIRGTLKDGHPVVLFAEGDCTWDGSTAPVFASTGKLAKILRVPLVTYRIEGNYLQKPRWAKAGRKGPVYGIRAGVYLESELRTMKEDELTRRIDQDIFVNVWENEHLQQSAYRCGAPARGLEQALFVCPGCHQPGTLKTDRNHIYCTSCGRRTEVTGHSLLRDETFSTVKEWDAWQKEEYKRILQKREPGVLFAGEGTWTDLDSGSDRPVRFYLDPVGKALIVGQEILPFKDILDMSMVKTNRLLVSCSEGYYELLSRKGVLRPYLLAWQIYTKENECLED